MVSIILLIAFGIAIFFLYEHDNKEKNDILNENYRLDRENIDLRARYETIQEFLKVLKRW